MKQESPTARSQGPVPSGMDPLLCATYAGMAPLVRDLKRLDKALDLLLNAGDGKGEAATRKLRQELREVAPSITMIGQVKAGKTTLVNALVGRPGLLPSDINPWTSVVTSVHVSPNTAPSAQRARFRFFTDEEWNHLLTKGGRLGELASRAGADRELDEVRRQFMEMREASRRRLGRKFEALLGQTHDYGYVDQELVQRYVCLGQDLDSDGEDSGTVSSGSQGRFADITRSADLYIGQQAFPLPICFRDTPGVNDTFMVREQITVNSIRASRLCVVVLSAHQALSTVDLALIRLIANVRARDVIIYVNRIDELSDPVRDLPTIRQSIEETLKVQNGPAGIEIIFGSADWASKALAGDLGTMSRDSADALVALAEHEVHAGRCEGDAVSMVWALSGLPALGRAIADRVVQGEGAEALSRISSAGRNVANGIIAARAVATSRAGPRQFQPRAPGALGPRLDAVATEIEARFAAGLDHLLADHQARLDRARQTFVIRATSALARHLEAENADTVWTYDPIGLRILLRAGYERYATQAAKTAEAEFAAVAEALRALYLDHFMISPELFGLEPPAVPRPPVPVMLGRTIALDIKGSWWTRWWRRRRSAEDYAGEFAALIEAEIQPLVAELHRDHAAAYAAELKAGLGAFLAAQKDELLGLARLSQGDLAAMRARIKDDAGRKQAALDEAAAILADHDQTLIRRAAE